MLSIARAIVEPRRLLLIDEPTKGLAPAIIGALIECLREIKRIGATMLLVEQNFRVAREVGDRVRVMDNGRIVHPGRWPNSPPTKRLQARLLGLSLDSASMSATDSGAALPRPKTDILPGADAAARRAGRRAVHRLALDLRHPDRRPAWRWA